MTAPLIRHIENYLRATGMSASLFGRESAKDPKLVFDLRKGRVPGESLTRRLFTYMEKRGSIPIADRRNIVKAPPKITPRLQPRLCIAADTIPRANAERELRLTLMVLTNNDAIICAYRERPWASATFVGARHYWTLEIFGKDHVRVANRLETIISEYEFTIRGHVVADANMTSRREITDTNGKATTCVTVEILTIEDD